MIIDYKELFMKYSFQIGRDAVAGSVQMTTYFRCFLLALLR